MSKKAVVEVIENAKIRKKEYFVKGYDITESIEFLLAKVEEDNEFKKQVELQFGLHSCNEFVNNQAEKYGRQIDKLKHQLALTEKAVKLACLSLRGKCDYCKYKDDEKCPPDHHCSNLVMEYFLEQAKESIKSE